MIYNFKGVNTFRGILVIKVMGHFGFWYCGVFPDSVVFVESVRQEKIGY